MAEALRNLALSKGGGSMTDFLESKIKPLVEALDTWPEIETFSSCEGHKSPDSEVNPSCDFYVRRWLNLERNMRKAQRNAMANNPGGVSHGPELHYTIRYVPRRLEDKPVLRNIQEGIPSIADMLRKDTHFERQGVENNFPVLTCREVPWKCIWTSGQHRVQFSLCGSLLSETGNTEH